MTRYHMRVRLSYYADVEVDADSYEQARDAAIRKAPRAMDNGHGCWGEEPSIVEHTIIEDEDYEDPSDYVGMGWVGSDGRP